MQQHRLRPFAAQNIARTVAVALAVAVVALLWGEVLLDALRILFGACVLSFLLSPVAALLERKLKRPLAALIALVGVILLLLLALGVLLPLLARQATGLMQTLPEAAQPVPLALDELVTADNAAFSGVVGRLSSQIGKNVARPQRVRAQAALLCGNRGRAEDLPVLLHWAQSDSPAVRAHAAWAAKRIRAQSGLDPSDKKR